MKILGLLLIALTTGTTNIAFASNSSSASSTALVIETNSGQVGYLAQVQSSMSKEQLDFAISDFSLRHLAGEKILDSEGNTTPLDYDIVTENGTVTLTIVFDSYQSFYDYNGIDLTSKQNRTVETKESLFFYERTITLADPYERFFRTNKTAAILADFNTQFNTSGNEVDYGYIYASSFRRTEVNSDKNNSDFAEGIWEYSFYIDPNNSKEIIIFDRFANTPIWYGVAVAAALIFMGVIYIVLKQQHKNQKSSTSISNAQLTPTN